MLLVLNLPLVGIWVRLLSIPRQYLYAGIVIFATIGAYGMRNSWFDLLLLWLFGILGYGMRRWDIPVAPVLIGMILGPRADTELRRALQISQSDFSVFLTRPIVRHADRAVGAAGGRSGGVALARGAPAAPSGELMAGRARPLRAGLRARAVSAARKMAPWLAGIAVAVAAGYGVQPRRARRSPGCWGRCSRWRCCASPARPSTAPPGARYAGQWIIGTSLALYFTPTVVRQVAGLWPLLVAGAAFAVALGYVAGVALARLAGIDRSTGIFASVPGGAAEMATLGERHGARTDQVAAAHSLRMLLVVAIVPFAFQALDVHGTDAYAPVTGVFDARGFALLMAATLAGCAALHRFGAPNAFVLGSLAVAIPLTAAGVELSSLPPVVSNAGQCLLGCALGARFRRDFLEGAPRFVAAVVATTLLSIALSAAFGAGLARLAGQPVPTLVLGTAPGGIAEMCITAKVLQLGVPLVTALHVTRVVVLLLVTAPLFAALKARRRR